MIFSQRTVCSPFCDLSSLILKYVRVTLWHSNIHGLQTYVTYYHMVYTVDASLVLSFRNTTTCTSSPSRSVRQNPPRNTWRRDRGTQCSHVYCLHNCEGTPWPMSLTPPAAEDGASCPHPPVKMHSTSLDKNSRINAFTMDPISSVHLLLPSKLLLTFRHDLKKKKKKHASYSPWSNPLHCWTAS